MTIKYISTQCNLKIIIKFDANILFTALQKNKTQHECKRAGY